MNRQWMYVDRRLPAFTTGLQKFIDVAKANTRDGFMCCPCVKCKNTMDYSNSKTLHGHLIRHGFMPSYNCWTKHGEIGVMMEENEEEDDEDNYPMFPEYGDTATGGADEEEASDKPTDDLGRVIADAKRDCESEKERLKLERMLEDHNG